MRKSCWISCFQNSRRGFQEVLQSQNKDTVGDVQEVLQLQINDTIGGVQEVLQSQINDIIGGV